MNKKFSFNTNFCKALIIIFLSDICNRKDKNYPLLNAVLPFDETKGKFVHLDFGFFSVILLVLTVVYLWIKKP